MKTDQQKKPVFFRQATAAVIALLLLMSGAAWGATVIPPFGMEPLNQIAVPEPANLYQFVKNKPAAILLGKALFWDMQVGSDGMTACATCHFTAGTDKRTKNTLHPGRDGIFNVRGVNQTVQPADFPFHQRDLPEIQTSQILRDSDDVVGSQGVRLKQFVNIVLGSRFDNGTDIPDLVFNQNGVNIRQVTGRNTPPVINAAFNFTNFWDGRASAFFNGVNPFGPLDTSAGVWFNVNGALVKQPVSIMFASLASQATGPPLSDVEMSYRGRTFPQLGRKMLSLTPLGAQFVHPDDSELGADSRASLQPDGTLTGDKGLGTTYSQMIKDAFQNNLWNSNQLTPDGYTQMEANFSLYWGLAIQLYEATLIADNTPFDRFLGGDTTALTPEQQDGFNIFFGVGRCDVCHFGSEQTNASHTAAAFINNNSQALIELMPVASGKQIIYDTGFNNTAVTRINDDIGRGGDSPFLNLLTGIFFPLSFSDQAELQASIPSQLPFSAPILPANVPADFPVANDGAFKVPGLRNVELTGPYMHNGSMATLDEMVDFYTRGGNFPGNNKSQLDINIAEIPAMQNAPDVQTAMVAFMKAMTDERVKKESAPFDHPEIFIPNGDSVNDTDIIHLPAIGTTGIPEPVVLTVTPGFSSPQTVGTSILFTAAASGGSGAFEYQFWLKDTAGAYTLVKPFSAANTWNWLTSGAASGTYTIAAQARNATGTSSATGFDAETLINFVLSPTGAAAITAMDIVTAPVSPQSVGTPVSFTATNVIGGSAASKYQFWLKDTSGVYTLVQPYSSSNIFNWDTAGLLPGIYTVAVQAKNADSAAGYDVERVVTYDILSPPSPPATSLEVLASAGSPQAAGTPVSFTATAGGSTGSYQYQFWLKDTSGVYTLVQPYSASGVYNWNTVGLLPGAYTVAVQAKSSGSAAGFDVETVVSYVILPPPATALELLVSPGSPQTAGIPVSITATAGGGSGTYLYQFWMKDTFGVYSLVQPYSAANVFNWNTAALPAGTYSIAVQAQSLGSATPNGYDVENVVNFDVLL